jgi:hypothetical protein
VQLLSRFKWEEDAAGRLLVVDFSNTNREEASALFELFDATVKAEAEGSVRLLADFEGGFHAPDLTRRWKEASSEHDRQIRRAALIGVTGGIKVVIMAYRFYLRLRGIDVDNKMRLFNQEGEARAWLAGGE